MLPAASANVGAAQIVAAGAVTNAALGTARASGCVITRTGVGIFTIDVPSIPALAVLFSNGRICAIAVPLTTTNRRLAVSPLAGSQIQVATMTDAAAAVDAEFEFIVFDLLFD